jgi:hypothetical protein
VNPTINLSFRYTESDYVRALRAHYASRLRLRLDLAATFLLLGIGIYLWQSPTSHWLGVMFVTGAVLFSLLLVVAFTIIPRLAFRREPKFRDEYSLAFSSEGIHFRTANIDAQLQWGMYSQVLIDAHSYVLYYGSRQIMVIPKRVFQSFEQQQAFEQLLTQQVSEVVRQSSYWR